jgi:hypothetical protein
MILIGIGVVTPAGVLAVNASAFIMQHLTQFRVTIAVCALLSGLILNGLTAIGALRYAHHSATPLFTEYRNWIIGLAVAAVLASSVVAAWLTYLGMANPRHLPDLLSVLGALLALGMPFCFTYVQRRLQRHSGTARATRGVVPGAYSAAGRYGQSPAPKPRRRPGWPRP